MHAYDLSAARWRKSSYSDENGGECLEIGHGFPGAARWRKSTYSEEFGNCIEIADEYPGIVPVRDSKVEDGPVIVMGAPAWAAFIAGVRG